ncbi:hypothetical protein QBC39DRAFT_399027 [Podospora conica]|nr:hypothetical protein QBC39DRAFT_399027 [Schizothecium conicum]
MPLPRLVALRGHLPRVTRLAPLRAMSTTHPRPVAMADGGRAADDIDLAFDYPSEAQATYTTPAGYHQERIDKEMGYPDQRLLYALIAGIGIASLYSAVSSIIYGPADHLVPAASLAPSSSTSRPITAGGRGSNPRLAPIAKINASVESVGHDADTLLDSAKAKIPAILGGKEEPRFVTVRKEGQRDRHLPSHPPTESKLERMMGRGG